MKSGLFVLLFVLLFLLLLLCRSWRAAAQAQPQTDPVEGA
jgi:hypothetical protein